MKLLFISAIWALFAQSVLAAAYDIDYAQSSVAFSGTHAGSPFSGVFEDWNAQIEFDPNNLSQSMFTATFNMASARTGDATYDGTLPQADWFDAANHPEARFVSTAITQTKAGSYHTIGELTIRGITRPVSFDFALSDAATMPVTATADMVIDRLAYDIGKASDAQAEWVSREITLRLTIVANQANER